MPENIYYEYPAGASEIAANGPKLRPELQVTAQGAEFQIGPNHYLYDGQSQTGMHFRSVGEDGIVRPILVYRSSSQGVLRASQGIESYVGVDGQQHLRLMKGMELSGDGQYTQDTLLHPDFQEMVSRAEETRSLRRMPPVREYVFDANSAEWYLRDFESQVSVEPLGPPSLDKLLRKFTSTSMSKEDVKRLTGFDPAYHQQGAESAYMRQIAGLNAELEASGVIPDFTREPDDIQLTSHPQLGLVANETFRQAINGRVVEWKMAHTKDGKAWIESIRFEDAKASPYGTDAELLYSGILTAKPLEYNNQCDGLPQSLRRNQGNGYSDITPFLEQLAPIAQYKGTYAHRDQFYHEYVMPAAA